MLDYDCLLDLDQRIKHILCHFHHQQGVTNYLKNHFEAEQMPKRKKAMEKVLHTEDKRTVVRRFALLKKMAQKLGIEKWVSHTEKTLPKLLPSVGSQKIPIRIKLSGNEWKKIKAKGEKRKKSHESHTEVT